MPDPETRIHGLSADMPAGFNDIRRGLTEDGQSFRDVGSAACVTPPPTPGS